MTQRAHRHGRSADVRSGVRFSLGTEYLDALIWGVLVPIVITCVGVVILLSKMDKGWFIIGVLLTFRPIHFVVFAIRLGVRARNLHLSQAFFIGVIYGSVFFLIALAVGAIGLAVQGARRLDDLPVWCVGIGKTGAFDVVLAVVTFGVVQGCRRVWSAYRPVPEGPTCEHCGYSLIGNVSGVCPECGRRIGGEPEDDPEWFITPRLMSLDYIFVHVDRYPMDRALYLPAEASPTLETSGAVLDPDEGDDDDPPFARQHGLHYACSVRRLLEARAAAGQGASDSRHKAMLDALRAQGERQLPESLQGMVDMDI